jgi:hypothetical protein
MPTKPPIKPITTKGKAKDLYPANTPNTANEVKINDIAAIFNPSFLSIFLLLSCRQAFISQDNQ